MKPQSLSNHVQLERAVAQDASHLADLRVAAMRPSLEAVGRFNPERARNRFLETFEPAETWKLISDGAIAGFFVLRDKADHLYLDHLYVEVTKQGTGLGKLAIDHIKKEAIVHALPLKLMALKRSPANGFYLSHGFKQTGETDLDNFYEWNPGGRNQENPDPKPAD